jgi:hypothetical protein
LACDDGLDEQDERIDSVPETIEDEEFPVVRSEPDFILILLLAPELDDKHGKTHTNSVINDVHFSIQDRVGVFE